MRQVEVIERNSWNGWPYLEVRLGKAHVDMCPGGVTFGDEEGYSCDFEDIPDLIACLHKVSELMSDPPPHLLSERLPRPAPKPCLRPQYDELGFATRPAE